MSASTKVLFPAPDGPETMKTIPWRSNVKSAPMRDSTESLDVLHLLSQALDFAFGLDHEPCDLELVHLRADGVDLAMGLLQQKLDLLADRAAPREQLPELVQMAAEPDQLLGDVAPLGQVGDFLGDARRVDGRALE